MKATLLKQFLLICVCLSIIACGIKKRNPLKDLRSAEGGVNYGGALYVNENEMFRGIHPFGTTEINAFGVSNQIYEGLIKLNQRDLAILPSLAEQWEIDSTNTVYTFHLRKGVRFHDDPCFASGKGREVTANDFKYCLTKLCEPSATNVMFSFVDNRILGAHEYFESVQNSKPLSDGVKGLKVVDDYTFQITLVRPLAIFLYVIAMPHGCVFPKEAMEKYGDEMRIKAVGTGPFKVKEHKGEEGIILVKNENYWRKDKFGNQLPYLDAIKFTFIKEKKSELLEFKKKNVDVVYRLPLEMMDEIVGKNGDLIGDYKNYNLQFIPSLRLEWYGFLNTNEIFKDAKVRKAFNYAIDRKKLVDYTLKGTGIQAIYGVVPPALVGYDSKAIKGYEFDPNKAKQLLTEAGYSNGNGFPEVVLQINSGGGINLQVAEAIQKMLKENINIDVKFSIIPQAQHFENLEMGKSPFFRFGWFADYPDPETYLNLFYGKLIPENPNERSSFNTSRYKNAKFDSLLTLALSTADEDERNLLYLQADQTAMDDAPIMPIYYEKYYRLLQPYVKNFEQNPLEYRDFSEVFFADDKKN